MCDFSFSLFCSVNANVDLIVAAVDVFDELKLTASGKSKDHNRIGSFQELDECFSHHFAKCAAAERFVESDELFQKITKALLALEATKVSYGDVTVYPNQA